MVQVLHTQTSSIYRQAFGMAPFICFQDFLKKVIEASLKKTQKQTGGCHLLQ